MMKKLLITLLFVSISIVSMSQIRYTPFYTKIEFRDTAKFIKPIKIGLVSLISTATELNLLHNSGLTSSDIANIRNSSSNLQTQINTKAPIANPQFTGIPRVSTDTLSTKAYARSVGGGTIIEGATDTTYVNEKIDYKLDSTIIAGTQLHTRSPYWSDTTSIIATQPYVDNVLSTLVIPSTVEVHELQGIIGTTSGFPANGDSIINHSFFEDVNYVDVYRRGVLQFYNNGLTHNIGNIDSSYVFIKSNGSIIVKPTFIEGEPIRIKTTSNTIWTALSLEGSTDPLLTGLMSYYTLDDSGSTAEDAHSTNDGIISAGVTTGETGIINDAFKFNGTSSNVSFGTVCRPTESISISFWFNINDITSGGDQWFVGNAVYATNWCGYRVAINTIGEINFFLGTNTATMLDKNYESDLDDGQDHHIVCTWDGSNAYIYVDNVKSTSTAYTSDIVYVTDCNLHFGSNAYADGTFYGGILDEVAIFNRAITDIEVNTLFKKTPYPF